MYRSDILQNEERRLSALEAMEILDTAPDEQLDFLTKIVKEYFQVPIALISIVDRKRQWFMSKQGLEASETPRDVSFCTHAILHEGIFVVNNAVEDSLFKNNPLVLGPPHIRFYAGIPLNSPDGYRIGTLCIIDTKAKRLSAGEESDLMGFAKIAQELISKRGPQHHLEALLDQAMEGLFEINLEHQFIHINEFGANLLGYEKEELLGKRLDILFPVKRYDGSPFLQTNFVDKISTSGNAISRDEEALVKKDGQTINATCNFFPVFRSGKVVSVLLAFRDNFERDALRAEVQWQRESIDKILDTRIAVLGLRGTRKRPRN
ncbi:GAF domain-containing protein [Polynucleobacter sp. MWH-Braz-FAM2G]|uniref:GAF domain-containing protein n=1 Tax=Polynucleobacter sp. MWH-Braz-FAM2G TaxID=1855883 RepID=UPI001BFE76E0|nr:GAF domain-containing protein [Polynucleobacter sp. MWH-Braz-FAM2G]QWD91671.1 PAS domain S-box protein [Polynucleobacter sp. MWH-Braz-FAM2G]